MGGHNLLPMKALTALLEQCGYQQIKTYIQSGNVVLQSPNRPDKLMVEKMAASFGFKPQILVLDQAEFNRAVQNNPFTASEGKTIHFYFLAGPPTVDATKLEILAAPNEAYQLINQVFYLYAPDGIGRSKLAAQVEKCMGVATTARNLNTVNKLLTMSQY